MTASTSKRPADYAGRVLFEPLAPLLRGFDTLPAPAALNDALRPTEMDAPPLPRFVAAETLSYPSYEGHVAHHGEVPTRSHDWHDFFNALAWRIWPRSKAALNRAHIAALAARPPGAPRCRRRDALTQFDECGLLVVSHDARILDGLAHHAWHEVFVHARAGLAHSTRFLVFGHALWDQLRAPFHGLCAKTLHHQVLPTWFAQDTATQYADLDAWLATQILDPACITPPRQLYPLPALGIPGVTPESEEPEYYDDERQFRRRRLTHERAPPQPVSSSGAVRPEGY